MHLNTYTLSTRRGPQVFFKKGDNLSKSLADNVQTCLNGLNEDVKDYSAITGDYFILNCSSAPSVICECGFLSNPKDEELLITEKYQKEVAYAIYNGIVSYFSVNSFKFTD